MPGGLVGAQPRDSPGEDLETREALVQSLALTPARPAFLAGVETLRRLDQIQVLRLREAERRPLESVGDLLGQSPSGRHRIALPRGAIAADRERLSHDGERAPAEERLPRVGEADRDDREAQVPARRLFGSQGDPGGARAEGRQGRLRMASPFGIDLDGLSRLQRRDRRQERVFVPVHERRIVLAAMNGQRADRGEKRLEEGVVEVGGQDEWPGRPSRDPEDHEGVHEHVRMVGHDQHRTVGHGWAHAVHVVEPTRRPAENAGHRTRSASGAHDQRSIPNAGRRARPPPERRDIFPPQGVPPWPSSTPASGTRFPTVRSPMSTAAASAGCRSTTNRTCGTRSPASTRCGSRMTPRGRRRGSGC